MMFLLADANCCLSLASPALYFAACNVWEPALQVSGIQADMHMSDWQHKCLLLGQFEDSTTDGFDTSD